MTTKPRSVLTDVVRIGVNCQFVIEDSRDAESSSNGIIKNLIRRNTRLVRVLERSLESFLTTRNEADWKIIPWVVRHAGCIIIYFRNDQSGRTLGYI